MIIDEPRQYQGVSQTGEFSFAQTGGQVIP